MVRRACGLTRLKDGSFFLCLGSSLLADSSIAFSMTDQATCGLAPRTDLQDR